MVPTSVATVDVDSVMLVIGASISVHTVHNAKTIVATNFMTANRIPFPWTSVLLSG